MNRVIFNRNDCIYICFACYRIDDIQDNAEKRNGISAAHSVYGIPLTISAAHYVIFNALKRITNLHPEVYLFRYIHIYTG